MSFNYWILAGSKWVKGNATKTNWKRCSLIPGPLTCNFPSFSVKVVARILRRILVTLYICTNMSMRVQQCVRFARYTRSISITTHSHKYTNTLTHTERQTDWRTDKIVHIIHVQLYARESRPSHVKILMLNCASTRNLQNRSYINIENSCWTGWAVSHNTFINALSLIIERQAWQVCTIKWNYIVADTR